MIVMMAIMAMVTATVVVLDDGDGVSDGAYDGNGGSDSDGNGQW